MTTFSVNGYFNNDNSTFENYIIVDFEWNGKDLQENGMNDDEIFFYGLSESDLKSSIAGKPMVNDFEVTSYEIMEAK